MTFKHTKFDSEVFRSLEKVALKNGMIKPEPALTKNASSQSIIDLNPTNDLMLNVIKLCKGLRASGFDKHADEVESKFFVYKEAASNLYDVSKEKGEDLVDAAHPEGSHKLIDVDGDSLVETILDRHLKMLEVVNKKPSGKFANNAVAIEAVKLALAQETDIDDEKLDKYRKRSAFNQISSVRTHMYDAYKILKKMNTTTLEITFNHNYNQIIKTIESMTEDNISVKEVDSIIVDLHDIKQSLNKEFGVGNLMPYSFLGDSVDMVTGDYDDKLRDNINVKMDQAIANCNTARASLRGDNDQKLLTFIKSKVETKSVLTNANPAVELTEEQKEEWQQFSSAANDYNIANEFLKVQRNDMGSLTNEQSKQYAQNFINFYSAAVNDLGKIYRSAYKRPVADVMNGTNYFKGVTTVDEYNAVLAKFNARKDRYNSYWS